MTPKEYIDRLSTEMKKNDSFSSEYIEQCCTYAEYLLNQNLPVFFDDQHVSNSLRLRGIREDCYHEFSLKKKGWRPSFYFSSQPSFKSKATLDFKEYFA